jgi:hypothetical protein
MGERNVEVFAISDHDSLGAYGKFIPPEKARVVTAIEINTTWRDNEVHVLGYRVPLRNSALDALLLKNRDARRTRMQRIVAQLQTAGYEITLRDIEREALAEFSPNTEMARSAEAVQSSESAEPPAIDSALGRPHVAKALIRAGHFETVDDAFRTLLTRGKPGYVPSTHIAPRAAIDAIHDAGGIAVLAHPGRLRNIEIIEELVQCGLDGLEVFYPRHSADETELYRSLAKHHRLVMSAGMDFHDIRYHTRGVGIDVDPYEIGTFLDRVLA